MPYATIRWCAILALSLFLSACVTSPASDARHESDLDVMVMGVEAMAVERAPAGDVKRAEDAQDVEDAWSLLLDLEDVDWLHEQDKARIVGFVRKAAARIKASRIPCSWWDNVLRREHCLINRSEP